MLSSVIVRGENHACNKLWSQVKDNHGIIKNGLENILDEQVDFYSHLVKSEGFSKEEVNKWLQNVENTMITEEQKTSCDTPYSHG